MKSKILGFIACFIAGLALVGERPAHAVTHIVNPSGVDDTTAIQSALDACSYPGANCTIQFQKGVYYTRILAAENFHGTIRGMGQDKTFLKPVSSQSAPDVDTCSETGWASPISKSSKYPVIMQFTGGSLTISDLTFQIDEPVFAPDQSWCGGFQGLLAASSRLATPVRSLFSALATSTLRIVGGADIALSTIAAENLAGMPKNRMPGMLQERVERAALKNLSIFA